MARVTKRISFSHPNPCDPEERGGLGNLNLRETTMKAMLRKVLMVCSMVALVGTAACASIDGSAGYSGDGAWAGNDVQLGDSQGA